MNEERYFVQLRDCFNAGYQFPQYCIENKINKPLFLIDSPTYENFLWEIHAQFFHGKRIKPEYVLLQGASHSVNYSPGTLFEELKIKSAEEVSLNDCDKIFFLTTKHYDVDTDKIIYLPELMYSFVIRTYVEIPFLYFLQKKPRVKIFLTNFPIIVMNQHNTDWEKQIIQNRTPLSAITEKLRADENYKTPYDFLGYGRQELLDMLTISGTKTNPDGSTSLDDNDNPLVRVENGQRLVQNQPEKFKNRIYFLGGCSHLGVGAPFDKTIESYLQKLLNQNHLPYRVENVSQFFTYRYQDIFYNLENLQLQDDDIVFVFFDNMLSNKLPVFDVSRTFERPHNYGEVYVDTAHVNELGYKALAKKFFDYLAKNNFFKDVDFNYPTPPPVPHRYGIPQETFTGTTKFFQNWKTTKQSCARKDCR